MAGGAGTRFWPASTEEKPKQFLDILGTGETLLQMTYQRFLPLVPKENIYIVTHEKYRDIVNRQIPGISAENIICEPMRNNTAPCVAYTAFKIANISPDANLIVAPSDHLVLHETVLINALKQALAFAEKENAIVTIGLKPTRPDTGYGYINFDKENPIENLYKVVKFTEKPDLDTAKSFIESGDYLWNGGIFVWNLKTILNAFKEFSPDIFDVFSEGVSCYNTPEEEPFIQENYCKARNISVDFAIMEKADNIYTIPCDPGWSDLGTWASLFEQSDKNEHQNVVQSPNVKIYNTENTIVRLGDKKALIDGLSDFIVVEENNVLLIYPKSKEQDIKKHIF